MMMNGCGGGMLVLSLLFLALIGGGVWLVVRALRSDGSTSRPTESRALTILEERLARGEIERAEFEERRRSLIE